MKDSSLLTFFSDKRDQQQQQQQHVKTSNKDMSSKNSIKDDDHASTVTPFTDNATINPKSDQGSNTNTTIKAVDDPYSSSS
jgi:hypothetical protein